MHSMFGVSKLGVSGFALGQVGTPLRVYTALYPNFPDIGSRDPVTLQWIIRIDSKCIDGWMNVMTHCLLTLERG